MNDNHSKKQHLHCIGTKNPDTWLKYYHSWLAHEMYDFRAMCGGRKVTRSGTGHRRYSCTFAHRTGKYKFRLHMRTSRKIYISHRFVAVSNCTFHSRLRKVSFATRAGGRFRLVSSLHHEPSSRLRLVSATLRFRPRLTSTGLWLSFCTTSYPRLETPSFRTFYKICYDLPRTIIK